MTDLVPVAHLPADPVEAVEPSPGAQADAWEFMRAAVTTLSELVAANPTDQAGLARTQLLAEKVRRELGYLTEQIRPLLIATMGVAKQVDLDGIGRLQRRTGVSYRAWDHDELRRAVRREAMTRTVPVDPETGELDAEAQQIATAVDETLGLVWDTFGKATPNAGGVRQLGYQPDEFATVKYGESTITITGGDNK